MKVRKIVPPIPWVGRKRVRKDRFYPFFLSILWRHGLAATLPIGKAGDVVRIVPARPRPAETWVDPDDLAQFPVQPGARLVTAVALGRLPVAEAIERLRSVEIVDLEVTALGPAAEALMLRGTAPQLRTACRVLAEPPAPRGKAIAHIVRLRHSSAQKVFEAANRLLGKDIGVPSDRISLEPHAATNTILVRGFDNKQVAQVVALIEKLDAPAEKR